jgi:hypothetical protein
MIEYTILFFLCLHAPTIDLYWKPFVAILMHAPLVGYWWDHPPSPTYNNFIYTILSCRLLSEVRLSHSGFAVEC